MLNRLRDQRQDLLVQKEILDVLVKTIENERHLMETIVKDECRDVIIEVQRAVKEFEGNYPEIEAECRFGLGEKTSYETQLSDKVD